MTLTHLKRTSRRRRKELFARWWLDNTPASYSRWDLPVEPSPAELSLPRTTLHRLIAERSGHGNFAEYHRRFGHDATAADCRCRCGSTMSQGHVFECESNQGALHSIGAQPGHESDLVRHKGHRDFAAFLEKARPYESHSPSLT